MTTDPAQIRRRIEEVYVTLQDEDSTHGALAWFARRAHVAPRTVTRWVKGDRDPVGPAIGLLEALEREAGIS